MNKKLIIIPFLIPFFLNGESIWVKYGNQVFRGVGDAKSIALSESEIASATGPLSVLYNPSLLNNSDIKKIVYSHQERFSGTVVFDVFGIDLIKKNDQNFSLAIIRESVQGIPNTNDALLNNSLSFDDLNQRVLASKVTFFNQSQLATIIGFSKIFFKSSLGANIKILNHNIGNFNGWGIGFDIGSTYNLSKNNKVGFSINDVTTSWIVWDSGTVERILPEIKLGYSNNYKSQKYFIQINSMFSTNFKLSGKEFTDDFAIDNYGFELRAGFEFIFKEKLKIRFGRNPINGRSIGVGTKIKFIDLDYAYIPSPNGTILGNSHYISFNIALDDLSKLFLN